MTPRLGSLRSADPRRGSTRRGGRALPRRPGTRSATRSGKANGAHSTIRDAAITALHASGHCVGGWAVGSARLLLSPGWSGVAASRAECPFRVEAVRPRGHHPPRIERATDKYRGSTAPHASLSLERHGNSVERRRPRPDLSRRLGDRALRTPHPGAHTRAARRSVTHDSQELPCVGASGNQEVTPGRGGPAPTPPPSHVGARWARRWRCCAPRSTEAPRDSAARPKPSQTTPLCTPSYCNQCPWLVALGSSSGRAVTLLQVPRPVGRFSAPPCGLFHHVAKHFQAMLWSRVRV